MQMTLEVIFRGKVNEALRNSTEAAVNVNRWKTCSLNPCKSRGIFPPFRHAEFPRKRQSLWCKPLLASANELNAPEGSFEWMRQSNIVSCVG